MPSPCMKRGHRGDGGWDMAALQPFHFHSISWAGFWANWKKSWCQAGCQLMNPTGFILDLCIWESSEAKARLGSAQQVRDAVKYQRGAAAPEALLSLPSMDQLLGLDCKASQEQQHRLTLRQWWQALDWLPELQAVSCWWPPTSPELHWYWMPARMGDGGTHPWKMSLHAVPGLYFEQCWCL